MFEEYTNQDEETSELFKHIRKLLKEYEKIKKDVSIKRGRKSESDKTEIKEKKLSIFNEVSAKRIEKDLRTIIYTQDNDSDDYNNCFFRKIKEKASQDDKRFLNICNLKEDLIVDKFVKVDPLIIRCLENGFNRKCIYNYVRLLHSSIYTNIYIDINNVGKMLSA